MGVDALTYRTMGLPLDSFGGLHEVWLRGKEVDPSTARDSVYRLDFIVSVTWTNTDVVLMSAFKAFHSWAAILTYVIPFQTNKTPSCLFQNLFPPCNAYHILTGIDVWSFWQYVQVNLQLVANNAVSASNGNPLQPFLLGSLLGDWSVVLTLFLIARSLASVKFTSENIQNVLKIPLILYFSGDDQSQILW